MQLKLRRTQRDAGVVSKSVIFCLDARADLTEQERRNLSRYKLYDQVIYKSEASKQSLDKSIAATSEGSAAGYLKGAFHLAMTALRLNVTARSLERGHHIECKSLDELIAAEDAIMQACENLKMYLEKAATFDGSELVVDFSGGAPQIVAQAIRPEPILAPAAAQPIPQLISTSQFAAEEATDSGDDEAEYEPVHDDYEPAANGLDRLVGRLSQATGLEEELVKLLGIVVIFVLLMILFGLFHG